MTKMCLLNIVISSHLIFTVLCGNTTHHYGIDLLNFALVSEWTIHDEHNEEYEGEYIIYKFPTRHTLSGIHLNHAEDHKQWLNQTKHTDSVLVASWRQYSTHQSYYLHLFYTADQQQMFWKFVQFAREHEKRIIYEILTGHRVLPEPALSDSWGLTLRYKQEVDSNIVNALREDRNCIRKLQKQLHNKSLEELRINEELADITLERDDLILQLEQQTHSQAAPLAHLEVKVSNSSVGNAMSDGNDKELSSGSGSAVLSYGMVSCVTALVMCGIFCIVYSYQKRRWKALNLRDLVNVHIKQKLNQKPVLVGGHGQNDSNIEEVNKIKKKEKVRKHKKWNPESFNQLVRNSVGVQNVLMDDVVQNMEIEGGDAQNVDNEIIKKESEINEGNLTR